MKQSKCKGLFEDTHLLLEPPAGLSQSGETTRQHNFTFFALQRKKTPHRAEPTLALALHK